MMTRTLWIAALAYLAACTPDHGDGDDSGLREDPLVGPWSATHPAVAPTGDRIAFMSNMVGVRAGTPINFEIYVMDLEGGTPVRITENDVFDADIAWSPAGDRIAYKTYVDGNDEIYVVHPDGSGRQNLTSSPASDFQPHWSPDGNRLVFGSDRNGTDGIHLMDLQTGRVTVLFDTEASESSPRFSPDGSWIAFVSDAEGNDDLYLMTSAGTDVRRLTSSPLSDWSPRWSPDGSKILFNRGSFDTDEWSLYEVSLVPSSVPTFVVEDVDSGNAAWHPDGDRLFFGRYVSGESQLFSAAADGTGVRGLVDRSR